MSETTVRIEISRDEALALFDWLSRLDQREAPEPFEADAEQHRIGSFLEMNVGGVGARQVAPSIWLIVGEGGVSISGRVVRSGATLP
jgi:hypothetical protein